MKKFMQKGITRGMAAFFLAGMLCLEIVPFGVSAEAGTIKNKGDANADGVFGAKDIVAAYKSETSSESQQFGADMNADGKIDEVDYKQLREFLCITKPVYLFDFEVYTGSNQDANAYLSVNVDMGDEYTFSFEYFVDGETPGTVVSNVAQAWGMGSKVAFDNNNLTGKGTYTFTFTADYPELYPTFESHIPHGKPKLYVWNLRLVKKDTGINLLEGKSSEDYEGSLAAGNNVSVTIMDPNRLTARVEEDLLPKIGDKLDDYMTITNIEQSGSQVTMSFANNSSVWEASEESYLEYTCYGSSDNVIKTEKVDFGYVSSKGTCTCTLELPEETMKVRVTKFVPDYYSVVVQ